VKRGGGMLTAAVVALSFAACSLPEAQPDLTRYYVLTAESGATRSGGAEADAAEKKVYLKAVNLPEFLRGRLMLVRLGENEVKYIDTARWAEPLDAGLGRVLRESLAGVEVVTRSVDQRDFDVVVHVRYCEGVVPAKVARLAARVEVFTAGVDSRRVAEDEFEIESPHWNGEEYGQLAAKLSDAARQLGAAINGLLEDAARR